MADKEAPLRQSYETVFCIFLVLLAFLWRENPALVYPQILWLFLTLLSLNLAAGWVTRRWPGKDWACAAIILANCAVITAILDYSGGAGSNLWVLFLLPIYTVNILLGGREAAWVAAGVLSFNTLFYAFTTASWSPPILFELAVKDGILLFAAAATWALVRRERAARGRIECQRGEMDRLERALMDHSKRLEQSEKAAELGWLASGVAHDLGTPLMVILGTAEYLLKEEAEGSPRWKDFTRIMNAASLCRSISSNLLGYARTAEAQERASDVHEVLEAIVGLYEKTLFEHNIRLCRDYSSSLLSVQAGRPHVQRIVLNLLANAKAELKSGGTLWVRTRSSEGALRIEIEDDGPGIPAEMLPKLFTPFASGRRKEGGTGLGLYLCRQIARKHGGDLAAENRSEGGARFTLTLPLQLTPLNAG